MDRHILREALDDFVIMRSAPNPSRAVADYEVRIQRSLTAIEADAVEEEARINAKRVARHQLWLNERRRF